MAQLVAVLSFFRNEKQKKEKPLFNAFVTVNKI